MSAFRNAIKRRAHRERAQTYDRQKFGLLEKKKDYKLRAKDYHRKQDAIRVLREKAAMRNPDEFYFKMNTTQSKDGVHIGATIGKQHTARELKRFKKQDAGNIQLRVAQEQKRIDALQAELHGLDERDEKNHPATIHRIFSSRQELKHHMKPSRSDSSSTSSSTDSESSVPELSVKVQRKRKARYAELEDRKNRKSELLALKKRLDTERALMGKGKVRKFIARDRFGDEDKDKSTYRWKSERKHRCPKEIICVLEFCSHPASAQHIFIDKQKKK